MSILLADDDVHLATFLSKSLESEGYAVHVALDENTAVAELRRQNYQLIILDLNFGQTDGLKLLEKLRSEGVVTTIIVLSARNKVSDRVQSLRLGADDYVTKPFSFQELAARVSVVLRRKADPAMNVLRVEDLELDPTDRRVTRGNRDIRLSIKEFKLLQLLMRHAGREVTRQELMHEVWREQPETDSNLVDVYVNYLRKKIESTRGERLIFTVRGVGYRLGRSAPVVKAFSEVSPAGPESRSGKGIPASAPTFSGPAEPAIYQQTPWRALVNSLTHDLAQPLTSVRCFLEVAVMKEGNLSASPTDLKNIEQQADRAIGLTRAISSLVREVSVPTGPWNLLDTLLEDVFEDFIVLLNSGLLSVERHWDPVIQVTSSPVLRQLLVLLLGKIAGKNTRPIALVVSADLRGSRCHLELRWKAVDGGAAQDAQSTLGSDLMYIQEMLYSIGGEAGFDGATGICLKLPASPHTGGAQAQKETVQ
ncbi:MAG TPA: response regulator [Candidatus Angelobacter sp.]